VTVTRMLRGKLVPWNSGFTEIDTVYLRLSGIRNSLQLCLQHCKRIEKKPVVTNGIQIKSPKLPLAHGGSRLRSSAGSHALTTPNGSSVDLHVLAQQCHKFPICYNGPRHIHPQNCPIYTVGRSAPLPTLHTLAPTYPTPYSTSTTETSSSY